MKRTEQHVDKGQVSVIICMDSFGMMICMSFRSLHDIAYPMWCFDIAMLKDGKEVGQQKNDYNRLGVKASYDGKA